MRKHDQIQGRLGAVRIVAEIPVRVKNMPPEVPGQEQSGQDRRLVGSRVIGVGVGYGNGQIAHGAVRHMQVPCVEAFRRKAERIQAKGRSYAEIGRPYENKPLCQGRFVLVKEGDRKDTGDKFIRGDKAADLGHISRQARLRPKDQLPVHTGGHVQVLPDVPAAAIRPQKKLYAPGG
jgi:hypothetical protein